MWKLTNTLLNKQWVKEEIKREIRKYFGTNKNRYNISKIKGHIKSSSSSKREVYNDKQLH